MQLQRSANPVPTKWTKHLLNAEALLHFWQFKLFTLQCISRVPLSCQASILPFSLVLPYFSCLFSFNRSSVSCSLFSQKSRSKHMFLVLQLCYSLLCRLSIKKIQKCRWKLAMERLRASFVSISLVAPALSSSQANLQFGSSYSQLITG